MKVLVVGGSKALCAAIAAVLLSGCGTTERVVVYEEKAVLAPEGMVKLCDIIRPPSPSYLMSLSKPDRFDAVANALDAQYLSIKVCNTDIDQYLTWRKKQEVFYKTMNGESDASQQHPK